MYGKSCRSASLSRASSGAAQESRSGTATTQLGSGSRGFFQLVAHYERGGVHRYVEIHQHVHAQQHVIVRGLVRQLHHH